MRQPVYHIFLVILLAIVGIAGGVTSAMALPADHYRTSSRLASGKWVKIKVQQEGLQKLSNAELKAMGFADPAKVKVFGYGGRRLSESLTDATPDDLPEQPVVRTSDGILFFGTGTISWSATTSGWTHKQNIYSTASYYFLTDGVTEDTTFKTLPYTGTYAAPVLTAVPTPLLHEQELFSAGTTGGDLFGEDFRSITSRTISFDTPDAADDAVEYLVRFGAKASSASQVKVTGKGGEEVTRNIDAINDGSTYIRMSDVRAEGAIEDDKSSVDISFTAGGLLTNARLDFVRAFYNRKLRLRDGSLHFRYFLQRGVTAPVFAIEGVDDTAVVWDVTDPETPAIVEYQKEGATLKFSPGAAGLREYVVFNTSATGFTPVNAGAASNQDIHGMEVPDMLIISPSQYTAQAERIAQMHRDVDGFVVHVLTPEAIYNEFSSGSPDVTAYRKALKMWYDRGTSYSGAKLQHCLLIGRATYDQRQLTDKLKSTYPRLLTWQTEITSAYTTSSTLNEVASFLTDNYIGMLDDATDFNMRNATMNIGVGRMPVKNVSEARTMTDKLLKYVANPGDGAWRNNVMLIADDGDQEVHIKQSEKSYDKYNANGNGGSFLYSRLYLDAFPLGAGSATKFFPTLREQMFRLLDEGVGLWQYVGHANPTSWTAESVWSYSDLTSMTNKRWPILYTASCEFVRFDDDAISGCELMWLHPDTGIIAAVAANRKVGISANEYMTTNFADQYYRRDADGRPRRLGDVYRSTINAISGALDDNNKNRYAIMGDPAMRVLSAEYKAVVDEVNGVDMSGIREAADFPVLKGNSRVTIKGSILSQGGQLLSDFNGTIVATLYDAEKVVETYGREGDAGKDDGVVIAYNDRTNRLFSGNFKVSGGKWEATLLLPDGIENNYAPARVTLYAYNDSNKDANGDCASFYIYGWDDQTIADENDPIIEDMYLDSPAFRSGSTVGTTPTFYATVSDESGINISAAGIGRQMTIVVDDKNIYSNVSSYFNTDAEDVFKGYVVYPLPEMKPGRHSLEFLVSDNAGNTAKQSFDFIVANTSDLPEIDIYTNANPAVSSVTFYVTAPETTSGHIDVYDLSGRKVWSSPETSGSGILASTWDLTDASGARVPRGIYIYRATMTGKDGKLKKAARKLAVGNP